MKAMGAVAVALRGQWLGLRSLRSTRVVLLLSLLFLLLALLSRAIGWLDADTFSTLRLSLIGVGVPIAAIVMAEIPLRDGMTHRTLLLSMLSPVSRGQLFVARHALVLMVLFALFAGLGTVLQLLGGFEGSAWGMDLVAIACGLWCYLGIWGLISLLTKHALALGLAVFLLADYQLARFPLGLRNAAPVAHVQNLLGVVEVETLGLPVKVQAPEAWVSALVLLLLGALCFAVAALAFRRRSLAELC